MNLVKIKAIFEGGVRDRIIRSDTNYCNINKTISIVDKWKEDGFSVVFTAGVFDIFTINHLLGLYHYKLLYGRKTKLIVSIDTDLRVSKSKSFVKSKGNTIKPILSWNSRALMVAKQSMEGCQNLVDLILQHGRDTCGGISCSHDDNVNIAESIIPDAIIVTSTSIETIKMLETSSKIEKSKIFVINENDLTYYDDLLGEKISNTAIIQRIKNG